MGHRHRRDSGCTSENRNFIGAAVALAHPRMSSRATITIAASALVTTTSARKGPTPTARMRPGDVRRPSAAIAIANSHCDAALAATTSACGSNCKLAPAAMQTKAIRKQRCSAPKQSQRRLLAGSPRHPGWAPRGVDFDRLRKTRRSMICPAVATVVLLPKQVSEGISPQAASISASAGDQTHDLR